MYLQNNYRLLQIVLDNPNTPLYVVCMATNNDSQQPQQWYSYDEVALLCRRSRGYIKSLCSRLNIPRIRQAHRRRDQRIALLPIDSVRTLQQRTVLRGH